ncbi:hypothetical protein N0O92_09965 [Alkalihalobacillus sp. MEB130]|uniref:hypothetical protein n=1 Tax=Alkalihalobacillus sp. MEB130 TaxID=2976704 RepID=UPI0028DECDDF|nr:hypothetical protein [Alkalihalobacillus sp. MEB130]MDT8860560.1 hypothetical protein [Alkalihalobacillus sp. MEB130]
MRYTQKSWKNKVTDGVLSTWSKSKGMKLLVILLSALAIYIVIQHEVLFRLFVILFLVSLAFTMNRKISRLPIVPETEVKAEQVVDNSDNDETQIFEKAVMEKEEALEKIDLDRTQLLEELFSKADLDDLEKQTYRDKIKEKESERSNMMQDLMIVKGKWQQALLGTKKYFMKEDPIKEIAASLESEKIQHSSIAALNDEVYAIVKRLSEHTIQSLKKNHYIDEDHNLTRTGYKALMKTVEKE